MLKRHKSATIFFGILIIVMLAITLGVAWFYHNTRTSNPHNYNTIGDIPVPYGYERIDGNYAAYSTFLRSLPLKGKGARCRRDGKFYLTTVSILKEKSVILYATSR